MITIKVTFDDPTYEALLEVAGRGLSSPATFIVGMVRRELGLPFPYEDSPLKDHPAILKLITTEEEKTRERDRKSSGKQSNGIRADTGRIPPGNSPVSAEFPGGNPADTGRIPDGNPAETGELPDHLTETGGRGKLSRTSRRNGAPSLTQGAPNA